MGDKTAYIGLDFMYLARDTYLPVEFELANEYERVFIKRAYFNVRFQDCLQLDWKATMMAYQACEHTAEFTCQKESMVMWQPQFLLTEDISKSIYRERNEKVRK